MRSTYIEQAEGFVWMALGIILCIGSIKIGLGSGHQPGSGFLPFLTGSLLGLLGIILTVYRTFLGRPTKKEDIVETPKKKFSKKRVYSYMALSIYPFLLEPLGFMIDTFLFLFFLFKILDPRKWFAPILTAILTVILSYLIFFVYLRINLPKGIFRIG